jgi:acetyl-CoA carboxylase carboxyltransferase component
MGSKHLAGDQNFAWPNAEIAVMGPKAAVKILHRKELADAEHPETLQEDLSRTYRDELASPFLAAGEGFLDDIITPAESRERIIKALETFQDKRVEVPQRKHGNIPL